MNSNLKKKSLGRGLSALLDSENAMDGITPHAISNGQHGGTSLISISQIEVNPFQPRTTFDENSLKELTESIIHYGLIQPVTIRRISKDKYQLISGERRFKASQAAGLTEIPAYVRLADDVAMLEMALIENTHRDDLDAIEEALGYSRLIEECKMTQEELSKKLGKDRTTITNYLRLLKLPPVIQLAIRERKITMGHARALINVDDIATQLSVFDKILDESLSVRETEENVRNKKQTGFPGKKNGTASNTSDTTLERELTGLFESNVKLSRNEKGKGKLVISFKSDEQLGKIVAFIKQQ